MKKATDVTAELSLPSIDVTLSYKGEHVTEVASPWSKDNTSKVFRYKVYVNVLGKGKTIFDFYGSIKDCNEEPRRMLDWFKNLDDKELRRIDKFIKHYDFPNMEVYLSGVAWTTELAHKKDREKGEMSALKEMTRDLLKTFLKNRGLFLQLTGEYIFSSEKIKRIAEGEFDSIGEPTYMDEKQILFAFRCFVDEGLSGAMNISDFQSEFGYTDAAECIRVHTACQKSFQELSALGIDADRLNEILNDLSEAGIE